MRKLAIKHALILAAGRGKRLMPYTADKPKCLVEVGGKPILFHQLRALEMNGINNVMMATGYLAGEIKNYAEKNFPHFDFNFVRNDRFEDTNDIYSLYLTRNYWRGPLFILDSDVLFHPKIFSELLTYQPDRSAFCVRIGSCGEEEMKVAVNFDRMVTHLSKELPPEKTTGESMGIAFFSDEFLNYLRPSLENIVDAGGALLYREAAIEKVISEHSQPLYLLDITRYPAIEIDFPEDLKRAEEEILPKIIGEFKI